MFTFKLNLRLALSLAAIVIGASACKNQTFYEAMPTPPPAKLLDAVLTPAPSPALGPDGPTGTPRATPAPSVVPGPEGTPTPVPSGGPAPTSSPVPAPTSSPAPTSGPGNSPAPTATPAPTPCTIQATTQNLRIMFMVDNSGATNSTDKATYYRKLAISDFLARYSYKTNLTYSFGYFSTAAHQYDMNQSVFRTVDPSISDFSLFIPPFGSASAATGAFNEFLATSMGGGSGIQASLTALKQSVIWDINNNSTTKWNYVVIFVSDGKPTDMKSIDLPSAVDALQAAAAADARVLHLSAVYFGGDGSTGLDDLRSMALAGDGQFVDTTNIAGNLVIEDVIVLPGCPVQ